MPYWVYIVTNRPGGVLYTGVTNDLARRAYQHRTHALAGFTDRYHCTRLVWCEAYADIREAIAREKAIKKWRRAWKIEAIEAMNPGWDDLYETLG